MDCASNRVREHRGPASVRPKFGAEQRVAVAALPRRARLGPGLEVLLQGGLRRAWRTKLIAIRIDTSEQLITTFSLSTLPEGSNQLRESQYLAFTEILTIRR